MSERPNDDQEMIENTDFLMVMNDLSDVDSETFEVIQTFEEIEDETEGEE